jgi:hypothetical protein
MMKAVLFDSFASNCQFFNCNTEINNGYGCNHPDQEETEEENGKEQGRCHCFCCPLGIEAEQEDLTDKDNPDAISGEIDWDGMCEDGEVSEGEYLIVNVGEDATEDEKQALYNYELYMHRYDKKWLDEHEIYNSLAR